MYKKKMYRSLNRFVFLLLFIYVMLTPLSVSAKMLHRGLVVGGDVSVFLGYATHWNVYDENFNFLREDSFGFGGVFDGDVFATGFSLFGEWRFNYFLSPGIELMPLVVYTVHWNWDPDFDSLPLFIYNRFNWWIFSLKLGISFLPYSSYSPLQRSTGIYIAPEIEIPVRKHLSVSVFWKTYVNFYWDRDFKKPGGFSSGRYIKNTYFYEHFVGAGVSWNIFGR